MNSNGALTAVRKILQGINPDTFLRAPPEAWANIRGNFRQIGSGAVKYVYETPIAPNLVFVDTRPHVGQDLFRAFARDIHASGDPLAKHFPKIMDEVQLRPAWIRYATERLQPGIQPVQNTTGRILPHGDNVSGIDRTHPQFTSLNQALLEMDRYLEPRGWGSSRGYDLHSANFMRRPPGPEEFYSGAPRDPEGTIVINDPVYSVLLGLGGAGVLGAAARQRDGGGARARA